MAKCAYCGTTILFGGKKIEDLTFCSDKCLANGQVALVAKQVPDDLVASQARTIHAGPCPVCSQRRGPVDVHTSHKVTSFILMTQWSSNPRVSCRSCGVKAQAVGLLHSLFLGWWGFPWGILMTPVQIIKNLAGMLRNETSMNPSGQLEQLVRMNIAANALEAHRQGSE
jgi:hypothetical protein